MNDSQRDASQPRVGVVAVAFPGYHLGEEAGAGKLRELHDRLRAEPLDLVVVPELVLTLTEAAAAGRRLAAAKVDCLVVVVTTFVPDHFIVQLLDTCDVPVFLWAVEREIGCLALVCGPMITATLFELRKPCDLVAADVDDASALASLRTFARAAMLQRALRATRIGYVGGKNEIMFSMTADDYTLKQTFGVTTAALPVETFYRKAEAIPDADAMKAWETIRKHAGCIATPERDALQSTRYYLAARALCEEHDLQALSINCFPHLKSRICLAVARLNDDGIAAACEGDLHSTLLMRLFQLLTGGASFNGDFLRLYPDQNDILFSHCGAGAFSLARCAAEVKLQASIETHDGLAVSYATEPRGAVTLANLMGARETFRLGLLFGESVPTSLDYEGNPLRVRFQSPVRALLARVVATGAGHHWNGGFGDWRRELELLCRWSKVPCGDLTADKAGPQALQP